MKKILAIILFVFLFLASNCFAAVTFRWIEVISDARDSEWRMSTDLLLDQPYSPSYAASFSVDSGVSESMNYLYFGVDVYDSGVIGTPLNYFGKIFSWNVMDESDSSIISATARFPLQGMRQVAPSTNIAISGDPVHPTVSWTNPEGDSPDLINGYQLRVVDAIDPTKLFWQTTISNTPPLGSVVTYTIPFTFQTGVGYLIRIEARQYSYFPVTGNGFGLSFPRAWDPYQSKWVEVAALLNRSTVFVRYGIPLPIEIDIKSGKHQESINFKNHGEITVAILSTSEFDASDIVDKDSLTFGRTGNEDSLAFCYHRPEDVNRDGLKRDLVCQFYMEDAGFQRGDTEGILKGTTKDGIPIEGKNSVRIVPCKK